VQHGALPPRTLVAGLEDGPEQDGTDLTEHELTRQWVKCRIGILHTAYPLASPAFVVPVRR